MWKIKDLNDCYSNKYISWVKPILDYLKTYFNLLKLNLGEHNPQIVPLFWTIRCFDFFFQIHRFCYALRYTLFLDTN